MAAEHHTPHPHGTAKTPPPLPAKPNILLISLDTLRYDATGLAPEGTNQTPFLRQLATNGVKFTHSYSTFDSTPESHFSMLTGDQAHYDAHAEDRSLRPPGFVSDFRGRTLPPEMVKST